MNRGHATGLVHDLAKLVAWFNPLQIFSVPSTVTLITEAELK